MSDADPTDDNGGLEAAELALGLLDGDGAREAMRRQAGDPRFAGELGRWQRLTESWLARVDGDEPPAEVLAAIERMLDSESGSPLAQAVPARGWWKAAALTSMAAALALAVALAMALAASPRVDKVVVRPHFAGNVTQISDKSGAPLLSAVYERAPGTLTLRVASLAKDSKQPELWVIPKGGKPRSLGLITSDRLTIELSPELRALLVEGAALAITLEPADGAPHDAPTGAIIGTAKLQSL